MNCRQFRDAYSDFADGLLDEQAEVRCHVHLAECADCRRFDATLRRGLMALRGLREPVPSEDFDERLLARLATERPEEPESRLLVGMAGAVMVLAVVGALGWEAHTWIAPPPGSTLARDRGADPYAARLAGERLGDYRSRFSVIPVSRDSARHSRGPDQPMEVTVDWMAP
jgi:predicted anti-sigma-YlaC factor YlaD